MISGLIAYPRSRHHEENDDTNHRERMFAPYMGIVEPLKAGHKTTNVAGAIWRAVATPAKLRDCCSRKRNCCKTGCRHSHN